jgi:Tfp pilus assembly protein PilX
MRGFLVVVVIVVVLVLGALEVIASRSLPVADRTPPNTSASTQYYWR